MTYPWHAAALARLTDLRDANQLPNAIALTCAPGWGHDAMLAAVSMQLLETDTSKPADEFAHPDFRWIAPEGAVIKIDQIRRLNEFAVQTRQAAPRKVAAVLDAHLLNANAANALLKTLEEPPANTHVLLATPFWGKLLPTIRSRCQRFQTTPDAALARGWLEQQGVEVTDAEFAEFGYAPIDILGHRHSEGIDLTRWLESLNMRGLSVALDQVLDLDLVLWLSRWYRRLVLHLSGAPIPNCRADGAALGAFADELLSIRRQIESSNAANGRLLLERLIVRWVQIQRAKSA